MRLLVYFLIRHTLLDVFLWHGLSHDAVRYTKMTDAVTLPSGLINQTSAAFMCILNCQTTQAHLDEN
jgi:hypothetical protein